MTSLVGQDAPVAEFMAAMRGGALHHAWLLTGPRGIGKAGFAWMAAARLLAEGQAPDGLPAGLAVPDEHPTARLIAAWSHPDLRLLDRLPAKKEDKGKPRADWAADERLARNISVDQVRTLGPFFAMAPSLSRRRVVIIDAADDLERNAANALLKHLEEPPAGTVFLLVSHAPGRLLPTIRSRCQVLRFRALDTDGMRRALQRALPSATPEAELAALIEAGQGSVGRALAWAGLDLAPVEATLVAIATDGDRSNQARVALGRLVSGKGQQARYEALLARTPGFIAARATARRGSELAEALAAWEEARTIAASAIGLNLDPAAVAFELGGQVARLAPLQKAPAIG